MLYQAFSVFINAFRGVFAHPKLWFLVLIQIAAFALASAPDLLYTRQVEGQLEPGYVLLSLITGFIGLFVFLYIQIAMTHYVVDGDVFQSVGDFVKPPVSLWRVVLKSMAFIILIMLPLVLLGVLLAMALGPVGIVLVGACYIFATAKLLIVTPFFIMNDRALLFSPWAFTGGYFWFLFFVVLVLMVSAVILMIPFLIIMGLLGIALSFIPAVGTTIALAVGVVLYSLMTMVYMAALAEAYKYIAEDRSKPDPKPIQD